MHIHISMHVLMPYLSPIPETSTHLTLKLSSEFERPGGLGFFVPIACLDWIPVADLAVGYRAIYWASYKDLDLSKALNNAIQTMDPLRRCYPRKPSNAQLNTECYDSCPHPCAINMSTLKCSSLPTKGCIRCAY